MTSVHSNRLLTHLGELGVALEQSLSDSQGDRIYVSRDFYATEPGQLSVFVDDGQLCLVKPDDVKGKDDSWCLVRDMATGQQGLIPSDIVEHVNERQARLNCRANLAGADDLNNASGLDTKKEKKKEAKKEKKKKISFVKQPDVISPPASAKCTITDTKERVVEYCPDLEVYLKQLLSQRLDHRSGKLIKVYAGVSVARLSGMNGSYKTIRVDEQATVQEMAMSAHLKYTANNCLSSNTAYTIKPKLYLRHCGTSAAFCLDKTWRLWQVIELAKVLSFGQSDDVKSLDSVPKKAAKLYSKLSKGYTLEDGVTGLKRHADYDFCTPFQFVLEFA